MTTPLTFEVETSEPECYGRAWPKTRSWAHVTSVNPNILPQGTMAKTYKSHSRAKQEQQLEDHAALLRDEVFNVIPGTVNMQCGTALKNRKIKYCTECSDDEVFQLPQVPDMPIAGSSNGQKVTFRSPVVRPGLISSTPHLVPQPVSFDVSRIPNS